MILDNLLKQPLLPQAFYQQNTLSQARALLGCGLITENQEGITAGIIVETEAYLGSQDPASHAYRGSNKRNQAMFGPPGHTYIYLSYGMYYCLNVVTSPEGIGEAVLIRALQPVYGLDLMQKRRSKPVSLIELCRGPGKLTLSLGLSLEQNGYSLNSQAINLRQPPRPISQKDICASTRIGLSKAANYPWRFYLKDCPYVSRTPRLTTCSSKKSLR